MKARLAQLRYQWRRIPLRTRMGLLIAVVAIAGLAWQHYSSVETTAPESDQQAAQEGEINHDGHDHDGHALGEYQPDPSELPPPPDFSPAAARVTAERFATNFAFPNGGAESFSRSLRVKAAALPTSSATASTIRAIRPTPGRC